MTDTAVVHCCQGRPGSRATNPFTTTSTWTIGMEGEGFSTIITQYLVRANYSTMGYPITFENSGKPHDDAKTALPVPEPRSTNTSPSLGLAMSRIARKSGTSTCRGRKRSSGLMPCWWAMGDQVHDVYLRGAQHRG